METFEDVAKVLYSLMSGEHLVSQENPSRWHAEYFAIKGEMPSSPIRLVRKHRNYHWAVEKWHDQLHDLSFGEIQRISKMIQPHYAVSLESSFRASVLRVLYLTLW